MITVFGSINLDLIGVAPTLMRPGETVLGTTLDIAPGGKGANQALAVARAGAEVRLIGCVGEDDFARQALALLEKGGVDLSGVRRRHRHTGVALIAVDAAGENMITVLPGANGETEAGMLQAAGIAAGDVLVMQLEVPLDAVEAAGRLARERGARVMLNLAPFMEFSPALLDSVDVLVVNETELAGVLGMLGGPQDDLDASVLWLAQRIGAQVVATLGGEGAVAAAGGEIIRVAALPISPVDTVGAGDTFVGYLAAGLEAGDSLRAALERAAVAGTLACLTPGAQPAIPHRDAVEHRLAAR